MSTDAASRGVPGTSPDRVVSSLRAVGPTGSGFPGAASSSASSWRDALLGRRDRLIASPAFQRWALRFPPTRWIVRRRARALFDLCAGFVYTQTLLACVQLNLFERLRAGPRDTAALADATGLSADALERLLAAAVSLRLLERREAGRWGLGVHGAALLGNPGVVAMVEHHATLYDDLRDPVALLRDPDAPTALSRYWGYCATDRPGALPADEVAPYSALMAASQPLVADEILDAWPFGRHRCLLDVGGGEGRFVTSVVRRHPQLRAMLFDLPEVVARARPRLAESDFAARVSLHGGSFLADALPRGADVASLVRVLHDHDDPAVLTILRAVRAALPDDGTLIVAEPMSDMPGAEPAGDAYFGFYTLAMRRGRPRTPERLAVLMREAGFTDVRPRTTRAPLLVGVLTARCGPASGPGHRESVNPS